MRGSLRTVCALSALVAIVAFAGIAGAQDLTPDPNTTGDPNGPPPPPPPLNPPGTVGSPTAPPPPNSTAAQLDQSSQEDSGIGLHFVYFQPEIGWGFANLGSNAVGQDLGTPGGVAFGMGAGAELITFQLGARMRAITTQYFNLWTVGGEFNYQPGSGRFWPRVGLAVGYAWANHWNQGICGNFCDLVDVSGVDVGLRAGVQYFVAPTVEIGADLGLDALFLKRKAISGNAFGYDQGSSSTGYMGVAMAHIGFHFP